MHTIFGIAKSSAKLEALLSSLEANSIPLQDITVIMPGEQEPLVPPEAARAEAVADDFSGNPRRAAQAARGLPRTNPEWRPVRAVPELIS